MPESVRDRPTNAHEKLFLFAKSERYHYDADAIAERCLKGDGGSGFISGKTGARTGGERTGKRDRKRIMAGDLKNARNVWTIAPTPFPGAHFATMPTTLAERCIKAGCPEGGKVLDPFGGAGTTGLAARMLGRRAVLIELNPEYTRLAEKRINEASTPIVSPKKVRKSPPLALIEQMELPLFVPPNFGTASNIFWFML